MFALVGILWIRCDREGIAPVASEYNFQAPSNFPEVQYSFGNNPVTEDGFELGRMLFYDPVLSLDSTIACANCHQQSRSFADPVHRFSKGVGDVSGFRNAPAIQNMAFVDNFFWDGGVSHLDFVPISAITSELEMQETVARVVEKLSSDKSYELRFAKAFGAGEITSQKMFFALSQFMVMMVSANSRYDKFIRNEGAVLTQEELRGLTLFDANCASCHATDLFSDNSFRNNGLDEEFAFDPGRERITESDDDRCKFKVPSLRNAELTAPYMHDGRFRTLSEVLDHYMHRLKDSKTLDPILKQVADSGIALTEDEKTAVIAFIKTLTDSEYIRDDRFSNPFTKN